MGANERTEVPIARISSRQYNCPGLQLCQAAEPVFISLESSRWSLAGTSSVGIAVERRRRLTTIEIVVGL
jgi:hypothetical protein